MRLLIGSVALCALLASAPAFAADAPKAKPKRECFLASEIDGFNAVDDQTVDVSVGVRDVYRLTLFSPSPSVDWTQKIGVRARGGSWICSGLDAEVIVPGDIGIRTYPVTAIRKLTPEEIKASRTKKKKP